jgi:hypothetical protein
MVRETVEDALNNAFFTDYEFPKSIPISCLVDKPNQLFLSQYAKLSEQKASSRRSSKRLATDQSI